MGGEDKYPTNAAVLENGTLRVTMGDGSCLDAKIPNVYTTGGKVGGGTSWYSPATTALCRKS